MFCFIFCAGLTKGFEPNFVPDKRRTTVPLDQQGSGTQTKITTMTIVLITSLSSPVAAKVPPAHLVPSSVTMATRQGV